MADILKFEPKRPETNDDLDAAVVDADRARELEAMADVALLDLDIDRRLDGLVTLD